MNRHFRFIRKTASSILMSSSEVLSLHYLHKTAITLVATLVGTISVSGTAEAIDINWIAGTGDWENDSNWSNGFGSIVPDEDTFAFVDNGGTAQVQTTDSVAGYVYIGNVNSGSLDIFGGGQLESFYNNVIGGNAGSSGAVTVDGIGSSWQLAGSSASLDVGASGEGILTITNGGEVLNADSFLSTSIGDNAGSSGTVTVNDAGSKLTNINAGIFVGNTGNGTLNILNGGSVSNTFGSVGRLSGATGTVTVDGAGSSWNNSNALGLGDWGNGTLNIINDGLVTVASGASTVELGRFGGSGTVNIGNGGAAGILNAAAVNGGSGTATLNFNHNESNYFFTDDSTSGGDTIRITGTTDVNFVGSGTTYISGNNTYTGSTNISSGKLVVYNGGTLGNKSAVTVGTGAMLEALSDLTIGSLAGNGTVDVDTGSGGFTLTVGGDNTSTVFSGTIIDFSYLTKTGTGTLTMTGNNPYYGATIVNDGLLVVNGSIANSGITVNAGGSLGGSGTLGSITINGGSLAPGNSIGTMNVSGSVDFSGGGVYEVEVDAAGNSDLINATAMATLTNGTVLVLPEAGNYSLSTDYTILSAAGGLGGTTFDSISSNLAFLTPTLTYDANNVFLNLERNASDYASVAETANQIAVSTTLDRLFLGNDSAGINDIFNNLNILSTQGAQQAYDSLSGVQHTHSNLIALQSLNQFQGLLLNRLQSGSPLADNGQIQLAYNDTDTMTDAGMSLIGEKPANTRGWWLRGTGSYADIDGTSNASGAYYKSAGTAAGRDIFVDDALTVGLAVGYNRTDASVSQGSLDVDSYQAALYGRKLFTDNYYVSGIAGVGYHDFESKRRVTVGLSNTTARADYHAWTSNIAVEIGRLIEVSENTNLTPLAGLEYAHVNRAGFVEKDANAANLKIRRDQQDSLRSAIGARVAHQWKTQNGYRIQPTAELAWVHELMDNEAQMRAGFAATSLANFQVDGPELDRNRARLALGLDMQLSELSSIQLGYQGEWASSDQRHDLSATFKMAW
ncbi:autotransporter domain-containing protein [Methylophaga sp.]|uniref:autotransporter outer membrane beta-barrel domain-containing protein n=1 Tax=Methylophaga sp. TaxID=2024840 RepID=UPI0025E7E4D7|nr:autotransporter domain-containing protein [Methylophaga sp.]